MHQRIFVQVICQFDTTPRAWCRLARGLLAGGCRQVRLLVMVLALWVLDEQMVRGNAAGGDDGVGAVRARHGTG